MRYIMAMVFGLAGAALAAWLLANRLSGWVSRQFTYASPDGQANVEQLTFLAILLIGLALGWSIGWAIGSPLARRHHS